MLHEPPTSVLVVKPSSFGDIIHTLPAVAQLKAAWPDAHIQWLANPEWIPLLEGNPDLDAILPFPRAEFRGVLGWCHFMRWQRQSMRDLRPDLAVDFQGLLRSALTGRLSSPGIYYGLADAREGAGCFYNRIAPPLPGVPHAVERYLALARYAVENMQTGPLPELPNPLRFSLPAGEALLNDDAIKLQDDFILLHPFARGGGKSLSMTQVQKFVSLLAPRQVVLIGRGVEGAKRTLESGLDLLGRTNLRQLLWIIRRAAFVISVDSGPAHLAAALGRPMIAIHTWSDPRRVGPYRPDAWVWKSSRLMQMKDLPLMPSSFFEARPAELSDPHIEAICAVTISP